MMTKKVNDEVSRRFLDAKEALTRILKPIDGHKKKSLVSLAESVKQIKDLVHDEQIANSEYSKQIKK